MRSNGARNVAIILEQKFRRSRQVLLGRAGVRDLQLFGRQRDAGDVGAGHFSQIEAKAAPARADVEHAVAAPDQQLCGEVTLLGELGVVERACPAFRNRRSYIACRHRERANRAARRDRNDGRHCLCARPRQIELPDVPCQIAQPPLQPGPARHHVGLIEQDRQRIRDRAVLDHERAVHKGFAERQFGIEQDPPFGARRSGTAPTPAGRFRRRR